MKTLLQLPDKSWENTDGKQAITVFLSICLPNYTADDSFSKEVTHSPPNFLSLQSTS